MRATQESVWLKVFTGKLGRINGDGLLRSIGRARIHCIGLDHEVYNHTKHIVFCYHFALEKVAERQVVCEHCSNRDMKADQMSKPVTVVLFSHLWSMFRAKTARFWRVEWNFCEGGSCSSVNNAIY